MAVDIGFISKATRNYNVFAIIILYLPYTFFNPKPLQEKHNQVVYLSKLVHREAIVKIKPQKNAWNTVYNRCVALVSDFGWKWSMVSVLCSDWLSVGLPVRWLADESPAFLSGSLIGHGTLNGLSPPSNKFWRERGIYVFSALIGCPWVLLCSDWLMGGWRRGRRNLRRKWGR